MEINQLNTRASYSNGQKLFKKNNRDAGHDIKSAESLVIPARSSALISTKLRMHIPFGFVALLWSRSGLSVNNKIEVGAGCIDSGYTGEIKVHLYNHGDTDFIISKDDRIAQVILLPVVINFIEDIDDESYEKIVNMAAEENGRTDNGFGSSGV